MIVTKRRKHIYVDAEGVVVYNFRAMTITALKRRVMKHLTPNNVNSLKMPVDDEGILMACGHPIRDDNVQRAFQDYITETVILEEE